MKKFIYGFLAIMVLIILSSCSNDSNYTPTLSSHVSIGNIQSNITLTEYMDYQCPACSNFHLGVLPNIKTKFVDTNRVKFTFVDFPLRSIHANAQNAAESVYCALDQNKFLEYQTYLYTNQRDLSRDLYLKGAKDLGMDVEKFKECIDSRAYKPLVDSGYKQAISKGINSTPTLLVNNIHVPNQGNLEEIELLIEAFESTNKKGRLQYAIETILRNNATLSLQRIAPDILKDNPNITIDPSIVNKIVEQAGTSNDPVVNLENVINEIVKTKVEEVIGKR